MFSKIQNYLESITVEMKKVTWMNKDELVSSSVVVGVFSVIVAIVLFFFDYMITEVMAWLLGGR